MKRGEVKDVFKLISYAYPRFEVTSEKLDTWFMLLKDQNPAVVMRNAERYVMNQQFPPAIADLRETKSEANNNDFLKRLDEWERDAVGRKPGS
ncbi:replicative helicase loader/inhibitor [Radiobacillus sp. PE A8.2]|uniref:replicative helicase loader/inhibitor n=1 Tax=Radiobacillus sp. PE A8.2 TaxID=3380349 RepID=UPI00388DDAB1